MTQATEMGGDISAAGTALAGLLLVFIGAVTVGFESFEKQDQGAVLAKFRLRGWLALLGFLLALAAAALSLAGKWAADASLIAGSAWCLAISFVFASVTAVLTVLDLK